jgi:hypothetical protein
LIGLEQCSQLSALSSGQFPGVARPRDPVVTCRRRSTAPPGTRVARTVPRDLLLSILGIHGRDICETEPPNHLRIVFVPKFYV